jgi:hypothetical protein
MISATKILNAKVKTVKKLAELLGCKKLVVARSAPIQPARLNAWKILRAKLKTAKACVELTKEVTKKLVVALTLNQHAGSKLVHGSAQTILLAKKVPFAHRYVETELRR